MCLFEYNFKYYIGLAWYCKKEYKKALDCYSKAIELDPKDCVFYFNKGESLRYLGEYTESLECLNKAIELNSNYAMAYSSKGQTLIELKNFKEAIICFAKAIEIEPNNLVYLNYRTLALKQQKEDNKTGTYNFFLKKILITNILLYFFLKIKI